MYALPGGISASLRNLSTHIFPVLTVSFQRIPGSLSSASTAESARSGQAHTTFPSSRNLISPSRSPLPTLP